jgi:glutamyl-tRNA reductase
MRKNAPVIKAVKQKLHDMHQCQMFLSAFNSDTANTTATVSTLAVVDHYAIQKVIKNMAVKMRQQHQPGCSYIEAINDFIATHRN